MKAYRSFTVRARLPEPLAPLQELAFNLRWSWDERTRDVFRWVDPNLGSGPSTTRSGSCSLVARERLEALSKDNAFMSFLGEIHADLRRYMNVHRWFQNRGRSALVKVAYFSPEFGIAEALPQYSGGLGILAGDHLKAASSLGVPMVGVGLALPGGLLPPAPQRRRVAGGAVPGAWIPMPWPWRPSKAPGSPSTSADRS